MKSVRRVISRRENLPEFIVAGGETKGNYMRRSLKLFIAMVQLLRTVVKEILKFKLPFSRRGSMIANLYEL